MTDISNWPDLVEVKGHYVMVPLNEYQMGNLMDALTQAQDNGDWWHELQDIVGVAMKKAGINEVRSNNGLTFTQDQVAHRNVMASVKEK